ncbi:Hypothetical predicted protein [Olea europaea subsp. europaea]|uniref:Uncharacterized protein n=1 Tax=Olea europaea subsp. europaea TaxID=158383 RepID=A0A8S0VP87_OLEEU|nr:Hypothetical predicted protein [Olea europaea subsp. europaea]
MQGLSSVGLQVTLSETCAPQARSSIRTAHTANLDACILQLVGYEGVVITCVVE